MDSNEKRDDIDSFDKKMQDFEARVNGSKHHKSSSSKVDNSDVWRFALRAGTELFSAFVVGIFIGFGFDYWLSTRPIFIIIFSVLGMVAGMLNVWRIIKVSDISEK